MRIITLSDHSADQEKIEREHREEIHREALVAWQAIVDARVRKLREHQEAIAVALRQVQIWTVIANIFQWISLFLASDPTQPTLTGPSDQEARWAGGQVGEQKVRACLGRLLGDEWVALAGYFNRGGEMDLLVLGPWTIVAIEVKTLNGVVHCRGNQWTRDKFDRYGNLVERGIPVRDLKGRAPNQQINESANALESFLASRGQAVKVRRAVVLAHDSSRLGDVSDPGVDFVGALTSNDFASRLGTLLVGGADHPAVGFDVDALVNLVQRDHAYHQRRKAARDGRIPDGVAAVRPPQAEVPSAHGPSPILATPTKAADRHALSPFVLRQIHSLRRDVKELHASHGSDRECDRRVRQAVSGYLQSGARWTVLSATGGGLEPGPERELLARVIAECRQVVELEDRTLHAIVVPMAVRLRSEVHAGKGVSDGAPEMLSLPSALIPRSIGALKVAFGTRLYFGKDLLYADARNLRDLMLQIEAGVEHPEAGIKGAWVRAAAAPEWQLVYVLGVAVLAPGAGLRIDTDEAQRALMNVRRHFAGVFTDIKSIAFNHGIEGEAVCEGFWSLDVGVYKGENLRRQHQLERVLATLDKGDGSVELWHAHAPREHCIRLLISSATGASEFRWELLAGESAEGFHDGLARAMVIHLRNVPTANRREIDLHAYEKNARDKGLSWNSNA